MIKQSESKYIFLAGGLGNQLSQLSYALKSSNNLTLKCITQKKSIEYISNDLKITPEINLEYHPRLNCFQEKYVHLWLRAAGSKSVSKRFESVLKILKLFSSLLLPGEISYLRTPELHQGSWQRNAQKSEFLIGYFQDRNFVSKSRVNFVVDSLISEENKKFLSPYVKALEKNVLVVHIRLGDYFTDRRLGIRPASYYENAISLANKLAKPDEIWIFSNDTKFAKSMMRFEPDTIVRWIEDEIKLEAQQILYLLKHARKFVISNSTLSWWGAVLSENPTFVITPSVWYEDEGEQKQLNFPSWHIVTD